MKPTKAWMCSEHNGDYCIPCRVVYIREEDIKPRGCLKLIPVTILPTPYFNALRGVAKIVRKERKGKGNNIILLCTKDDEFADALVRLEKEEKK